MDENNKWSMQYTRDQVPSYLLITQCDPTLQTFCFTLPKFIYAFLKFVALYESFDHTQDLLMLDLFQCQNVLKFTRHETGTIDTVTLHKVSQVLSIYFPHCVRMLNISVIV